MRLNWLLGNFATSSVTALLTGLPACYLSDTKCAAGLQVTRAILGPVVRCVLTAACCASLIIQKLLYPLAACWPTLLLCRCSHSQSAPLSPPLAAACTCEHACTTEAWQRVFNYMLLSVTTSCSTPAATRQQPAGKAPCWVQRGERLRRGSCYAPGHFMQWRCRLAHTQPARSVNTAQNVASW